MGTNEQNQNNGIAKILEENPTQPSSKGKEHSMDEYVQMMGQDGDNVDLGDMDMKGLEYIHKDCNPPSIPPKKMELLKEELLGS